MGDSFDDNYVIAEVVAGNRDEYRRLIERYEGHIYGVLARQLGEPIVARELTHDTFVKAFFALSSFRGESAFSTWLTRIGLNCANTYLRSEEARQRLQKNLLRGDTQYDTTGPGELGMQESEEARSAALHIALSKLSPKLRDVISICCLERKTYNEAAAILEIPYGTVCSRMNSALQELRRYLQRRI